jgi:hypothetical protein
MLDALILQASKLMQEQAESYGLLNDGCARLAAALIKSSPEEIETLTKAGESELLRMRSRLVRIMSTLTMFAETRAAQPTNQVIAEDARRAFEEASNVLASAARDFQRIHQRAAGLAMSGETMASASIEMCGFQPMTYRAPYARHGERAWA